MAIVLYLIILCSSASAEYWQTTSEAGPYIYYGEFQQNPEISSGLKGLQSYDREVLLKAIHRFMEKFPNGLISSKEGFLFEKMYGLIEQLKKNDPDVFEDHYKDYGLFDRAGDSELKILTGDYTKLLHFEGRYFFTRSGRQAFGMLLGNFLDHGEYFYAHVMSDKYFKRPQELEKLELSTLAKLVILYSKAAKQDRVDELLRQIANQLQKKDETHFKFGKVSVDFSKFKNSALAITPKGNPNILQGEKFALPVVKAAYPVQDKVLSLTTAVNIPELKNKTLLHGYFIANEKYFLAVTKENEIYVQNVETNKVWKCPLKVKDFRQSISSENLIVFDDKNDVYLVDLKKNTQVLIQKASDPNRAPTLDIPAARAAPSYLTLRINREARVYNEEGKLILKDQDFESAFDQAISKDANLVIAKRYDSTVSSNYMQGLIWSTKFNKKKTFERAHEMSLLNENHVLVLQGNDKTPILVDENLNEVMRAEGGTAVYKPKVKKVFIQFDSHKLQVYDLKEKKSVTIDHVTSWNVLHNNSGFVVYRENREGYDVSFYDLNSKRTAFFERVQNPRFSEGGNKVYFNTKDNLLVRADKFGNVEWTSAGPEWILHLDENGKDTFVCNKEKEYLFRQNDQKKWSAPEPFRYAVSEDFELFYLVDSEGELSIYDRQGKIRSIKIQKYQEMDNILNRLISLNHDGLFHFDYNKTTRGLKINRWPKEWVRNRQAEAPYVKDWYQFDGPSSTIVFYRHKDGVYFEVPRKSEIIAMSEKSVIAKATDQLYFYNVAWKSPVSFIFPAGSYISSHPDKKFQLVSGANVYEFSTDPNWPLLDKSTPAFPSLR